MDEGCFFYSLQQRQNQQNRQPQQRHQTVKLLCDETKLLVCTSISI